MIQARNVSKSYARFTALRGVSFDVPSGQVVGLLGPNGAGKTTTIRIVTGFFPPTGGNVSVCGFDTVEQSIHARRSIGYLPEAAPLYPEMSVEGYLDYRGRLMQMDRAARLRGAGRCMDRCHLRDVAGKRIGQLSKGYKQRVGLAAAMLHNPQVLVLDEPVSGLDPAQIRETRKLMRELASDHTVLVSSHILPEVELTCDRVIIMARGRVRADGTPSELVGRMSSEAPYLIEVRKRTGVSGAQPAVVFGGVPGVAAVRRETIPEEGEGGANQFWERWAVVPQPRAGDLRETLARAAGESALVVRELHREGATLEQLFLRLIEEDDGGATAAAPSGEGPSR
ncbi:MAG: ABC transporter ATP-binding protein [Phycisphaerales bacterium]|nr:ABC transporter ATP-binding protein [Phycisphaerales bacterium]